MLQHGPQEPSWLEECCWKRINIRIIMRIKISRKKDVIPHLNADEEVETTINRRQRIHGLCYFYWMGTRRSFQSSRMTGISERPSTSIAALLSLRGKISQWTIEIQLCTTSGINVWLKFSRNNTAIRISLEIFLLQFTCRWLVNAAFFRHPSIDRHKWPSFV